MDESRFDALSRALIEARSRRGLTRLLGSLLFGGALPLLGLPESQAKRKKGGGKKRRKKRRAAGSPPPPPPGPTCADGIKNGSESDVDCGGFRCPRCANGKLCTSAHDCASGSCGQVSANTRCQTCIPNSTCGFNPIGDGACECLTTPDRGNLCLNLAQTLPFGSSCDQCPNGTVFCTRLSNVFPFRCYTLCGDASVCPAGADFCATGAPTCGADGNGMCLQMIEGGTRCGFDPSDGVDCTTDRSCQDIYGEEAFCARNTGSDCGYPDSQLGFCAITH